MNTIFRQTTFTLLLSALLAVGVTSAFAQDPCGDTDEARSALADRFRAEFPATDIPGRKKAINTGKEYFNKYGACSKPQEVVEFVVYLKKALPGMEAKVNAGVLADLYTRLDTSVKSEKYDDSYTVGKEILSKVPDQLDVKIVLGSIGYDESFKKNFKYNADTVKYAREAINDIKAGKTSKTFGQMTWTYKNKDNALFWLNYTIGYITFYAQNDRKGSLQYLYEASKSGSDPKATPLLYEMIGIFYVDELNRYVEESNKSTDELNKLITEAKKLTDEQGVIDAKAVIEAKTVEDDKKRGLVKGAAERAADAYARAVAVASAAPAGAVYRDGLKARLKAILEIRFKDEKAVNPDDWSRTAVAKPIVDPKTTIEPIILVKATPAATVTTAPATTTKPTTTVVTKPGTPPMTKPVAPAGKPVNVTKPAGSVSITPIVKKKPIQ